MIGVPDEQWGETVKAIVVLRQGATATEDVIIDFCRGKLGGFDRTRVCRCVIVMRWNALCSESGPLMHCAASYMLPKSGGGG